MMITLNLQPHLQLTNETFEQLCRNNPDLRLERTAQGKLVAMSPTGSESGRQNLGLSAQLWVWNQQTGLGVAFDSSTGFTLPNGAIRAPDAAWIEKQRWERLSRQQRRRFAPICPDFVVELLSPTDALETLQIKLQEYMDNGAKLGWLIDPDTRQVYIYRPQTPVEILDQPTSLSGETILPNFEINLELIWNE
jgi:Uma2 family endonuclease